MVRSDHFRAVLPQSATPSAPMPKHVRGGPDAGLVMTKGRRSMGSGRVLSTGTRLRVAVVVIVLLVNAVHGSSLSVLPWALLVLAADVVTGAALAIAPLRPADRRVLGLTLTLAGAALAGLSLTAGAGGLPLVIIPLFRAGEEWGRKAVAACLAVFLVPAVVAWVVSEPTNDGPAAAVTGPLGRLGPVPGRARRLVAAPGPAPEQGRRARGRGRLAAHPARGSGHGDAGRVRPRDLRRARAGRRCRAPEPARAPVCSSAPRPTDRCPSRCAGRCACPGPTPATTTESSATPGTTGVRASSSSTTAASSWRSRCATPETGSTASSSVTAWAARYRPPTCSGDVRGRPAAPGAHRRRPRLRRSARAGRDRGARAAGSPDPRRHRPGAGRPRLPRRPAQAAARRGATARDRSSCGPR